MRSEVEISMSEYRASKAISKSDLSLILQRPSLFKMHKDGLFSKETRSLALGTLVHTLVLEPEEFEARYRVIDATTRTTAAYKAATKEEKKKELILGGELKKARTMAGALLKSDTLRSIFEMRGDAEKSFFTSLSDVPVKVRPDWISKDGRVVVDVKTTRSGEAQAFEKSAHDLKYALSAYMTSLVVATVRGLRELPTYIFACVESSEPFDASFFSVEPESEAWLLGKRWFEKGIEIFKECEAKNIYPGLPDCIVPLGVPAWAMKELYNV